MIPEILVPVALATVTLASAIFVVSTALDAISDVSTVSISV